MTARTKRISDTFATNNYIAKVQTKGLSHEDSLIQAPFRANTMNWVLGHMLVNRNGVLELLGQPPYANPETDALYRYESDPMTDPNTAVPLSDLLAGLKESHRLIETVLQNMDDAALEQIVDEEKGKTVGDQVEWLAWHETYHAGQLELLRQLAGTDDKVI